jgi:hypothetical protein
LTTLAVWALAAITMTLVTAGLVDVLGRIIAPQLASSLALLLLFMALAGATWAPGLR